MTVTAELELAGWRREVSALYAAVREEPDHERSHALWGAGRDELFRNHPQSPLPEEDPLRSSGLPYWPYDPALRFELEIHDPDEATEISLPSGADGETSMRLVGRVRLPPPLDVALDVWWLQQYAGGLFLPVRDATSGDTSYGGGRYLLDTVKGADLGGSSSSLVVDLNFLYHPSCRYNDAWQCPLAQPGNTVSAAICAGERL
jgi:uncharacterized protein (DUF1684 family)